MVAGVPVAIAIMAKIPRAGSTKTRLCPPLQPDQAAKVAAALFADTLAVVRQVPGAVPCFAFSDGSAAEAGALAGPGVTLLPQQGASLSDRMPNAVATLLKAHRAVLLLGADTLGLREADLARAIALLEAPGDRAVLGPATDGGYWLLGLKRPHHAAFQNITWSIGTVLAAQLGEFARENVPVGFAATLSDADTWPDILRAREAGLLGPATARTIPA
jgi:rSAM/selenodomain-associated transferase 1